MRKKRYYVKWQITILLFVLIIEMMSGCENQPQISHNEMSTNDASMEQIPNMENETFEFFHPNGMTLSTRIEPPKGYVRTKIEEDSFGGFVRNFKLKPHNDPVLLYNGEQKRRQDVHVAVFDLPLVSGDLQQCADSVMRMYAEYYYAQGEYNKIGFHFVSGFWCDYSTWKKGGRIQVSDNQVSWINQAQPSNTYESFEAYLSTVFMYASTLSMQKESKPVPLSEMQIGDVFLKAGSPGHVCMIVDICEKNGKKAFLLAQGFMPAQEFHILKNPMHPDDPWYYVEELQYPFHTPEYMFSEGSLCRLVYHEHAK